MRVELVDATGAVVISRLPDGRHEIEVEPRGGAFIAKTNWKTGYSLDLIKAIFEVKGASWLCDEIMREEDPAYTQSDINYSLLGYVEREEFNDKLVLDFGCGSGASTIILSRMFPAAKIVGVELDASLLTIARRRATYYKCKNVEFQASPRGDALPDGLGKVDYIFLSAVYEHLLPGERGTIPRMLWEKLNDNGVVFINQTPDRRFPIETHTTGLPLINYFPDSWTLWLSRKFSGRIPPTDSWESLLRKGVRGATANEIVAAFGAGSGQYSAQLMRPNKLGIGQQSDIWFLASKIRLLRRYAGAKGKLIAAVIALIIATRIPIAPYLSLAIRKVT